MGRCTKNLFEFPHATWYDRRTIEEVLHTFTMNNPMIRMTGGLVDEDDSLIGRVNIKSLSGEIKSMIFDSFASLDDNNNDDCFGLDIETAMRAMEASPSRKQHPMYETLSSLTSASLYGEKPSSRSEADDNTNASSTNSITSANDDSTKPKRPLSAYNLFFQLERERIIAGIDHLPFTADDVERVAIARRLSDMQPEKPKRKHRKSHGKITFAELARAIANRWRGLDATSKGLLIERAALEKSRFLRELEDWTKIHGADEDQDQDKAHPKEVRITAICAPSSTFEGKPPMSQRAAKPRPDVPTSQSRPPMHPPINRTVTPDTRMKCAMEMTAFANMRISNNSPSSQMLKSRSAYNNFQQLPNQSPFGSRFDTNFHRHYNNQGSLNAAIAARSPQAYSTLQEDYSNIAMPNRALVSRVRDPMNASTFMHSSSRNIYDCQFRNEPAAYGTASMPQTMVHHNNNNNHSSSNMDQLLANVEYELSCSKVTGEKLSKLLVTLQRNANINNNTTNNNSNNLNNYNDSQGSQYM